MQMRRFVLPVFCVGLLAGLVVMNIGKSVLLDNTGFFDVYTLYHIRDMTVDTNALFYYVFRKRILGMLTLAVLSTTYLGLASCLGGVFWYGMSAGAFVTALVLRYGIKGILLAAVCLLPQYLVYIPALLVFLKWAEGLYYGIYSRNGGAFAAEERSFLVKKSGQLIAVLCAFAIGCLLEAYINPMLLAGYLKIF